MERRDLPGNDASWYEALLIEQRSPNAATVSPPPTDGSSDHKLDPDGIDDSPVTSPIVGVEEDPVHFPPEDLQEAPVEVVPDPMELDASIGADGDPTPEDTDDDDSPGTAETAEPVVDSESDGPEIELRADLDQPSAPAPIVVPVGAMSVDESPMETTSERVGQMWTAQETTSEFDAWVPDEMDKTISSTRGFRWTTVVAAVSVVALIALGLVLLPSIARNRANAHRDMLTSALADLREELPDTQGSLATATEPSVDVAALSGLATQLTVLTARASTVEEASQADLPTAPPFTSSQPIDDLEPIRQRVEPLGSTAQTIQRRIANLVEYRTLMDGFLVLPDLPNVADTAQQTELRVILAAAQADSASILGELPNDVSLAPHHDLARTINEEFGAWQVDYLEALRNEDGTAAAQLVSTLRGDLERLHAELVTPLAQIRRQTDTDLIELARSIDEVANLANGISEPGL